MLAFTFHHTDQEGKVWEGLLEALCENGFEVIAVYPIHAESETSLHLMNKENISYDLIHVCRKRQEDPRIPFLGRGSARGAVGRPAKSYRRSSAEGIVISRCLNLMCGSFVSESAWNFTALTTARCWITKTGRFPLHRALQDISAIVDQLVTKDRPLPSELVAVDGLSYVSARSSRSN